MIENIKEEIGKRITKVRKEQLGITIKELASRTAGLSAQRISNWEQGTRSPGPMEAKQLADVLNVSASYLLCLTDNPDGEIHLSENNSQYFVPLFNFDTAHLIKENQYNTAEMVNILTDTKINKKIDANCFAMKIEDASMNPIFEENDLIIVSPETKPQPGQFVIAYLPKYEKSILRRYSESDNGLYQLHPNSDLWAVTNVKKASEAQIIGVVIEHRRYY